MKRKEQTSECDTCEYGNCADCPEYGGNDDEES